MVALSRIARKMAMQDFDARWQGTRNDEIGALGESLNLLSENLSRALAQLREANAALQSDIDRERALEPVSYTHLDVYKRQVQVDLVAEYLYLRQRHCDAMLRLPHLYADVGKVHARLDHAIVTEDELALRQRYVHAKELPRAFDDLNVGVIALSLIHI